MTDKALRHATELRAYVVKLIRADVYGDVNTITSDSILQSSLRYKNASRFTFPSRYSMPDYKGSEYVEMQAFRDPGRGTASFTKQFDKATELITDNSDELKRAFAELKDKDYDEHPVLRDVKDLFDMTYEALSLTEGSSVDHSDVTISESSDSRNRVGSPGRKSARMFWYRTHRFIDPVYRKRRLAYLERHHRNNNNAFEAKYRKDFLSHPDTHLEWPGNKGPPNSIYPSPGN